MTTVTANTRLARRMRRDFDLSQVAAGLRFWEAPDILPWGAWLGRMWSEACYSGREDRLLLSASQEQALWEQAIAASPEAAELMSPAGAAALAAEAWKLMHDWHLPGDAAAFQGIPDAEAFFRWMQTFQKSLSRQNFITGAELPGILGPMGPIEDIGFDEPTPAQKRLLEMVGSTTRDHDWPLGEPVKIRMGLPGSSEELLAAAHWAREKLEANPAAALGVVIPDLTARRAAVARTFRDVLGTDAAFHLSAPEPLADAPLIHAALTVLELLEGISMADCGTLLRSPYFPHSQQAGARVDLELRRQGATTVTLARSEVARLFPGLSPLQAQMARSQRPSGWSRDFSRLVSASGWPGPRTLSSAEYQVAEGWQDLLAEFVALDAVVGEISFKEALKRFEALARDTGFGPADEDEPVQVMGVLEAAGARFDAVWIAGLEDRVWPPAPRPNPFLPLAVQRVAGAPNSSAEQQFQYARRVTNRLLRSAPEVVCSYPLREGEEVLRPSPFIAELPESIWPYVTSSFVPAPLQQLTEDAAPPLVPKGAQHGGMNVIADQSACPFRAFARYRLQVRALQETEPGLSPMERGNVTHQALEWIWDRLKTQQALIDLPGAELRTLVSESVGKALASRLGEESRKLTAIQSLEAKRLTTILGEWLEIEKQRPSFEVATLETKRHFTIGGLELEIKTDRADRYVESGTLAIIDYKTGRGSTSSQWHGERPKAPQVPLYCVAAESPVSSVLFAQLVAGDIRFIGHSDSAEYKVKPHKQSSVPGLVESWGQVLRVLGEEFVSGEARVDPAHGYQTCALCDLQPLCRVSTEETEEEVDE